jgi:hypothetical protein
MYKFIKKFILKNKLRRRNYLIIKEIKRIIIFIRPKIKTLRKN